MRRLHAVRALLHAQKQYPLIVAATLIGSLLLLSPPASSAATTALGTQTVGPTTDYNPQGWAEAFSSVASATASVDTLTVYVDASSTAQSLVAGLYADANGAPVSLMAQGYVSPHAGSCYHLTIPQLVLPAWKTY